MVALPTVPEVHPLTAPLVLVVSFYIFIEALARRRGLNPDTPPEPAQSDGDPMMPVVLLTNSLVDRVGRQGCPRVDRGQATDFDVIFYPALQGQGVLIEWIKAYPSR